MHFRLTITLLVAVLTGCALLPPSAQERLNQANELAQKADWEIQVIPTSQFNIAAYTPTFVRSSPLLSIYIEGDGLAWISKSRISSNPTPVKPIGLMLALQHPSGAAAYLGRPCQYVKKSNARGCNPSYWTDGRFSLEVVESSNQAIDVLMKQYNAKHLQLIGYSGGGAVASLVAAQRNDVISLITVAGNLDHRAWTRKHHITPLGGSLNPADVWQSLKDIPQVHFVGGQDRIVGEDIAESYRSRFPSNKKPVVRIITDFDHSCCWAQEWPKLINSTRSYLAQ